MSHPENFLPWEQIEPLVRPGMTASDLRRAILEKCGLPLKGYAVVSPPGTGDIPASEAIRFGVRILTRQQARKLPIRWARADEVIA